MNNVIIKWTGSKRLQAPEIIKRFPSKIKTYYEAFTGGGSMFYQLLKTPSIKCDRFVCSDLNEPLIGIWELIKNNPEYLLEEYKRLWSSLDPKGNFYYETRDAFNEDKDPCKLFFLVRVARNGLVRYNKLGKFNSGFHFGRKGTHPDKIEQMLNDWKACLADRDVVFKNCSYQEISSEEGDLIYLDPPYATPTKQFMYFGMIDFKEFWEWLGKQPASFLLSLNGFKGDVDCRIDVPRELYSEQILIDNGLNKYDQLYNKRIQARDSLYIKVVNHET